MVIDEISEILEILNLPNSMEAEELLNNPEENIIYEISEDSNQIIAELIEIFNKNLSNDNANDLDDDSTEMETISINVALKNLDTIHKFLLQQENANKYIKLIDTIENFVRSKQTQTTIDQYFS